MSLNCSQEGGAVCTHPCTDLQPFPMWWGQEGVKVSWLWLMWAGIDCNVQCVSCRPNGEVFCGSSKVRSQQQELRISELNHGSDTGCLMSLEKPENFSTDRWTIRKLTHLTRKLGRSIRVYFLVLCMWKLPGCTSDNIYKWPQINWECFKMFVTNSVGARGMVQMQERNGNGVENQLNTISQAMRLSRSDSLDSLPPWRVRITKGDRQLPNGPSRTLGSHCPILESEFKLSSRELL